MEESSAGWDALRQQLERDRFGRAEWPTWVLLVGVQLAWFGLLWASAWLGRWPTTVLLVPVVTLWMSVQHELLHGHPTRLNWLNKLLGYAPYALWYPYTLYRDSHLAHHDDEALTLPGVDPESRYVALARWARLSSLSRTLRWVDKTVPGRLLIGAPLALLGMAGEEGRRLLRGERQAWLMWGTHGLLCVALLAFVEHFSTLSAMQYVVWVSVPALALAMLRSFYEHRPAAAPQQRSVLNEAGWPWRWLFLNLNLHLVHHDLPWLPWYRLPAVYRERRGFWLARSGGFLVRGYGELIRRHALRPVDNPQHPFAGLERSA
ncbi:fatty acid desaturase [Pseudomonas sp. PDNC002]|uniref:fatty acid desaturase n=1 Tax=Pseudomonas sp. PDNC002 TaxID=2811422 RepID=UPI001965DD52|nr:fatty acid desaturase [Pseudomonas sp. PDNC002]QRY77228.1 fatty acid desaturase [Pseudomonas sp. PDNC002]